MSSESLETFKILQSMFPEDIVMNIVPFTYNFQNGDMLNDIANSYEAKIRLLRQYHEVYIKYMGEPIPEDKYWLINDIHSYMNCFKPSLLGYTESFYNTFYRNPFLKTQQDVWKYVKNMESKHTDSQINTLLGLLSPKEREDVARHTHNFIAKAIASAEPYATLFTP